MGKKKATEMEENIEIQLEETTETGAPVVAVNPSLKPGYVHIKRKGKEGNGIIVHAKQFGTLYTEDKWELVSVKKK